MTGCTFRDGAILLPEPLPAQQGGEPIAVEGEECRSPKWQDDGRAPEEAPGAAGGRCVAFMLEGLYPFSVNHAGYYFYWQRVRIPRRAGWNHSVQIDDRVPLNLSFGTRPEDKANVWFWIRGSGRQYLTRGVHTLAIRNLCNGKQLDRWVLTRDEAWTPVGEGPPPTAIRDVQSGEYLSAPLAPVALERWLRLRCTTEGEATTAVALGDGAFVALPPGGGLAGDASPLRVRIRLKRAGDGASPRVILRGVEYLADRDSFLRLGNPSMEMLIQRETGRICGLRRPETGRRYLPDGVPSKLFEIMTKAYEDPEIRILSSDDAVVGRIRGGGRKATLDYTLDQGRIRVRVAFRLDRTDWLARARLTVENRGERDVVGVRFPILAQARAGGDSTDDVLCFPSMSGRLIPEPGRRGTITNIHPLRAAIGFCDLHDRSGGLTLAPLDWPMVFSEFTSAADPGRTSTTLSLTRGDRVKPGRTATFTAGFGLHTGDWHVAADRYRKWFEKKAGKPRLPDWAYGSDGWVTTPDVEDMAGLGFDHIQLWRNTGYEGCPTYYYPNQAYRSEADYTRLAAAWRALGGHMGVYFHGNGMSRSYIQAKRIHGLPVERIPPEKRPPSWDWFVRNHAYGPERKPVEMLDMTEVPEPARREEYPNMCFQAGDWTRYLRKWAIDIYLGEYGLDTPYWDTLACRDAPQFNPFFGMNGEGRGAMARYRFLLDMRKLGVRRAPGFYQTVEGGSELLGLVAGQLESNFVKNLEVARYTHPDQLYYVGHSNGWWNPPRTHLAVCMAFWLNTKLDLIRTTPKVMQVVRTRRWLAPWLYRSRFMDRQGMDLSNPKIRGALHVHKGRNGAGALVATFMNWQAISGEEASISVGDYLSADSATAAFFVVQGRAPAPLPRSCRRSDGRWVVAVSAAPVSAVLFLSRHASAVPVLQAVLEEEAVVLRVFDPARKERRFALSIETEEAAFRLASETAPGRGVWQLNAAGDEEPGGAVTFARTVPIVRYENLRWRRHARITLRDGALRLQGRVLIAPRFEDPGFEAEQYDNTEAKSGLRSLKLMPENKLWHAPLALVPGHRYRVSLWIKRLENQGNVYANIHHHLINKSHVFGSRPEPGEWRRVETTFRMEKGLDQPHLYVYNWQGTTKPVWYDDVRVEDLGEEEP